MVFRITNYCNMGCLHCMEESTTKGNHAAPDMIDKMIKFAQSSKATSTLQISGGEPTSHPDFKEIVVKILNAVPKDTTVYILSNGEFFVNDKNISDFTTYTMYNHNNLNLQITSVDGLYPTERFVKIKEAIGLWIKEDINRGILDRFLFVETLFYGVIPVGRALDNRDKVNEVVPIAQRAATSCFNLYNSLQHFQGRVFDAIEHTKTHSRTALCKPLITEQGLVKFGEYEACSTILDLSDFTLDEINPSMIIDIHSTDGACGSCISSREQVDNLQKHLHYPNMFSKLNI